MVGDAGCMVRPVRVDTWHRKGMVRPMPAARPGTGGTVDHCTAGTVRLLGPTHAPILPGTRYAQNGRHTAWYSLLNARGGMGCMVRPIQATGGTGGTPSVRQCAGGTLWYERYGRYGTG